MLFVGVSHVQGVSKKTNEPYDFYSLQALVKNHRFYGCGVQTVNISPNEWDAVRDELKPGIQFRAFSDGGIMVLSIPPIDLSDLDNML